MNFDFHKRVEDAFNDYSEGSPLSQALDATLLFHQNKYVESGELSANAMINFMTGIWIQNWDIID